MKKLNLFIRHQTITHEHERGIIWNDPDIDITWGIDSPILSLKDKIHKGLVK